MSSGQDGTNMEDAEQRRQMSADTALVDKALQTLGEHFDSVQIFCTRHEGALGGTINLQKGCGDWFSRFGLVAHWMMKVKASAELEVAAERIGDRP